ncbi:MAG: glycosyltransferase, partial [Pseudomonadota bacterium]|nr:glycosyltransferase [Pseudomonadota bacterium]
VFWLAQRGDSVCVVTSRQRYDDPGARLASRETVEGVGVYRVWTSRFGRHFLPGRAVDYLTFYVSAAFRLWRLARRGDVVVVKTDPPLVSVMAGWVLQLDNFRQLKGYGWPGFRKMNLRRQDKGQKACAAAFLDAVREGRGFPIPVGEILEVSRISIEIAGNQNQGK